MDKCRCMAQQHGDVVMEKVDAVPESAQRVEVKEERFVIERGEGIHTHTLECKIADLCDAIEVYEKDGIMYVKANKQVELNHEEHGVQILKPGIYKKNIERVYDYEANEERRVQD